MKEKLYTIPLTEAMERREECPFCLIADKLEQDALDFTLGAGATYMESDIRDQTDKAGFCKNHYRKMYEYGNTLGNALILHTYYQKMIPAFKKELEDYRTPKSSLKDRFKKTASKAPLISYLRDRECSCFICSRIGETYERYLDTFFYLFKTSPDFVSLLKESKGFCLPHFKDVMEKAPVLSEAQQKQLADILFPVMLQNIERLEEEISWLVDKFDYRNADAPWKNSKDALPRGIQKISGNVFSHAENKGTEK